MRETASPGIAGRTAGGTWKNLSFGKETGIWPVTLERLPNAVLVGPLLIIVLSVRWEPCVPWKSYLLQRFIREQLCSWPRLHQAVPEGFEYVAVSQPDLMFALTSLAASALTD